MLDAYCQGAQVIDAQSLERADDVIRRVADRAGREVGCSLSVFL